MRPRKSEQYPFSYFVATFMAHLRAMHRSPRVGPFTSSVHRIATACITAEQSLVSSRRSEPAVTKVDVVDVIGIQEGCQSWNNATSVSAVPLSGRATSKARGKSFKRCWRILQSFLNGQECRQRPNFAQSNKQQVSHPPSPRSDSNFGDHDSSTTSPKTTLPSGLHSNLHFYSTKPQGRNELSPHKP
jgi:hypothetical protein